MYDEQSFRKAIDAGFASVIAAPATKALISTIPQCDHLTALLQSIYAAGITEGVMLSTEQLLESIMKDKRNV